MSLRVVFLGTAGSVPTPKRSLPAILIQRKGEHIMLDCGEGLQRQMMKARTGFHRKMKILVSHLHGDHVLGLPGLLQTMALLDRERKLEIYGPPGMKRFIKAIRDTVQFVLTFPIDIHEITEDGVVCDQEEYTIEAIWTKHVIPSLAYALVEKPRPGKFYPDKALALNIPEGPLWTKLQHGHRVELPDGRVVEPEQVVGPARSGRKIVYTSDTRPFGDLVRFAAGADLLIHEATLGDDLAEKAEEDGHSTVSQAAQNAREANVKKLVLVHVSARYDDTSLFLTQAKKIFENAKIAEDFQEIEIPFPQS